jgi:hypothetical protein
MEGNARSQKIIVSQPVQEAMARLKAAQALLADLETRLDDETSS